MDFEWDTAKRTRNLTKHGVDFAAIDSFLWDGALTVENTRSNRGEARFVSIGLIGTMLRSGLFAVGRAA